jgi:DNA modification methylase
MSVTVLKNSRVTRTVSIDDLKTYAKNPFRYPQKLLRKIEALIREHDQIPIIPVTADLTIIGFEEWVLALKRAGRTEVKVEVLADLSAGEADVVRLALGRIPLDARLDQGRLRDAFEALQAQNIDLYLTAFDQAEIDFSLEIDMPRANVIETPDNFPQRQEVAVAKLDDVFQLDRHRIACGDARNQALIDFVRDGREADVCITDPPYNRQFSKFGFGKKRYRHGDFIEASGEMSEDEFGSFLWESLRVLGAASARSALIYVFMDWRHIFELTAAGRHLELPLLDIAVWAKPNGGLGGLYRSAHELCAVFKSGIEPHRNNVELGKFGRNRTNVWNYAPPASGDELLGAHPTVKPVAMISDILRDCTKRGDLVLDSFLGSGSSLIAAEETGRICVGTELDPHYVDTAIRRWQSLTGLDAVHLGTGQPFNDITQHLLTHQGGIREE